MAYRKDLERNAAAMMKIKNPVTPEPGETQNINDAKRISQKNFERKLKKAKKGEVFKTEQAISTGTISFEGPLSRGSTQTYFKKGKKTYIHRNSPDSDWNTDSYLVVKNKK